MAAPRGLVLMRAGRQHCAGPLLRVPRSQRSWDIALSCYDGSLPAAQAGDALPEWLHQRPGGKWDGIWHFFAQHPQALQGYDHYWLVDDDIETNAQQVEALFAYVRQHGFWLAQPALSRDSYFSHRLTLACPGFAHRHTNLVEIMAPLLAAPLLQQLLPRLQHTRSGFGLDWHWQTLVPEPARQIAIIDQLPVRHGRPLRQHLRGAMQRQGITPEQERQQLAQALGLQRLHAVATSGLLQGGRRVPGRLRMAWHMARAYWRVRAQITRRHWGLRQSALLLYRQFFAPLGYPPSSRSASHV
ncbi:MAG: hypothetical protein Q4A97_00620 [Comamonadaceae bacterium]|nr:hypothetical protein [Comamonadaceae bacterium]